MTENLGWVSFVFNALSVSVACILAVILATLLQGWLHRRATPALDKVLVNALVKKDLQASFLTYRAQRAKGASEREAFLAAKTVQIREECASQGCTLSETEARLESAREIISKMDWSE